MHDAIDTPADISCISMRGNERNAPTNLGNLFGNSRDVQNGVNWQLQLLNGDEVEQDQCYPAAEGEINAHLFPQR